MSARRWMLLSVASLTACSGCTNSMKGIFAHAKPQAAAKARWDDVRAGVKLQLAESQFRSGRVTEALRTINEAVELEPANAGVFLLLARIRLEQGQLGAARQAAD